MPLESGLLLHNRYRISEILGQGGMGSIYRAIDENLGVEVAVKENLFTTDEFGRQFRQEAIILANLRHPNLPRVSDHFVLEEQGQYLIMDYIRGEDLRDRMERDRVIPELDMLSIGIVICDALNYMHTRMPPVLHRDIKPGNVRITMEGDIYLVDFGLAKVVYQGQETSTGARAMTPGYSPPEQYGAARTDHRSDIYSLGATMYAALTGSLPEDSLARTMNQIKLTPVRKRNPRITPRTAIVIEKALSVHPKDRIQTAKEFREALVLARNALITEISEDGLDLKPFETKLDEENSFDLTNSLAIDAITPQEEGKIKPRTASPFSESVMESSSQKKPGRARIYLLVAFWVFLLSTLVFGLGDLVDPSLSTKVVNGASVIMKSVLLIDDDATVIAVNASSTGTFAIGSTSISEGDGDEVFVSITMTPELFTGTPSSTQKPIPTKSQDNTAEPTRYIKPKPTHIGGGSGQVAFASSQTGLPQIWTMNIDGTALRQITTVPTGACQPGWSPDGTRLVFISPCDENWETYVGSALFIIDADGSNMVSFPIQGIGNFDPAWSPDGRKIAFTALKEIDRPQIWIRDLETEQLQLLSEGIFRDYQPSWSPDGSKIIFVSTRQGPFQIWTMNPDGTDQERFSVSGDLKNTNPVLSPSGQLLVFTQSKGAGSVPRLKGVKYPDGAAQEFYLFNLFGYPMKDADFSPDGFWVIFESWPDGESHDIFFMSSSGAELTQITFNPTLDFDPSWRPLTP